MFRPQRPVARTLLQVNLLFDAMPAAERHGVRGLIGAPVACGPCLTDCTHVIYGQ